MVSPRKELAETIPRRDEEGWYPTVVARAELADYSPVRGCMVIRPYGYTLWENMQARLDARFKATGHKNAYFPLLVPESLLQKEAEHVEGFAPEVAWVTHAGREKLEERLAIRPTSETIFGVMYSKWVQSWRDLPLLLNQWCNVVRWEKRTTPFLRTTEFLWQEGHTAHRTAEEAQAETMQMLEVYRDFVENDLAIPVVPGRKSDAEKFPGADATYTIEAVMLPIWGRKDADRGAVRDAADRVRRMLLDAGLRVEVDWSEEKQIGWKHNEWTLKGVPVRIELGPRDVADEQAVLVRRDDPNPRPEKKAVPWSGLASALSETLSSIQSNLYERAVALRTAKTTSVETFDE